MGVEENGVKELGKQYDILEGGVVELVMMKVQSAVCAALSRERFGNGNPDALTKVQRDLIIEDAEWHAWVAVRRILPALMVACAEAAENATLNCKSDLMLEGEAREYVWPFVEEAFGVKGEVRE